MPLHVAIRHQTLYRYARPAYLGPHTIRLRPAPHCRTPIVAYSLRIEPAGHFLNWQQDPQGNFLARVVFPEPTRALRVDVDLVAEMSVIDPFDFFLEESAEHFPFEYEPTLRDELEPFLDAEPAGPRLQEWVAGIDRTRRHTNEFLVTLNQQLAKEINYVVRLEPGVQTPEETLASRKGSCRDSAWLLVQILRNLGIAARFASGYLIQLKPDVASLDGPSGTAIDFTDLHAWAEAFLPGAGWVGLDATSGLLTGEGHIPLACSAKPPSAAPITGSVDVVEVEFSHSMSVERILESPRVTLPYTEAQWKSIDALGDRIDTRLEADDVRLTMGGEPTFVSIDDYESAEWNTEAMGATKRALAEKLIQRLRDRFAPDGLLRCGDGKSYPDEPQPRWALSLDFRGDGMPLERDATPRANTGDPPPGDSRMNSIRVTPAPGVIEVDVHPASNWRQLVATTTAVYEEARACRLGTEKFMVDGRHTGTGGGNHFVLGGETPADSPFLRRPDVLRSLIAFWLNHPSLSFLFSGQCIDKLYSPDSASGGQGLVEVRGFEMPPHSQMSLTQQLLLRALVAHFWREPYGMPLLRHGVALQDRFLLPHFVWSDFRDVLRVLRKAGFGFAEEWFGAHYEFRFPILGTIESSGVEIEIRQALEPLPVLAAGTAAGGAAHAVDSSLERVQICVRGLGDRRYQVGCNGVRVPLQPTGTTGEFVAGVQYRARQPADCLHPAIPIDAPLTLDLFDTWTGRVVAGCRYHVTHPGRTAHEKVPVNAYEAESRRMSRFFEFDHTPGLTALAEPPVAYDHPCTLDLRVAEGVAVERIE